MISLRIALLVSVVAPLQVLGADFPKLALRYVADWPQLPQGVNFGITTGVGVDSANNVYVFNRGPDPVLCFDSSGKYLRTWGRGLLNDSHGLAVDADDNIWVTDIGSHVVVKFNSMGRVLMVLGQKGTPGESETQFNMPTHVAFGPSGKVYVSDGYGNSRIVKFTARGEYVTAWGKKGKGPGEFNAPHSLAVDGQGQVYVGDRENHRLQIFDSEAEILASLEIHSRLGVCAVDQFLRRRLLGISSPSGLIWALPGGCIWGRTDCSTCATATTIGC